MGMVVKLMVIFVIIPLLVIMVLWYLISKYTGWFKEAPQSEQTEEKTKNDQESNEAVEGEILNDDEGVLKNG